MGDKIRFVRLAIVLLLITFIGRLVMGALGASYEATNRVFSMVILQVHLALLFGAFARPQRGYGIFGAMTVGLLIGLTSQILIVAGTAGSYILNVQTHFTDAVALNVTAPVGFSEAMKIRAQGLVVNCVMSTVAAAIGCGLSFLIPDQGQKN